MSPPVFTERRRRVPSAELQGSVQSPQLAGSLPMSVSQPLRSLFSSELQSPKPGSQAMLQEAARRREQLLQEIAVALQRIDSGDYGYCDLCDDEISEKRLEINPTVRYCIACSSRLEER